MSARVLAATNKDLEAEVKEGNFREDLFFRLNVVPLRAPALRERLDDVPMLAERFFLLAARENGLRPKLVAPGVVERLALYRWPGNVRELRNLMERIAIMNPKVRIEARHIPFNPTRRAADRPMDRFGSLQEVREAAERDYILRKLDETAGNVSRAAELLGLERSHLYRKMKALGISPKE